MKHKRIILLVVMMQLAAILVGCAAAPAGKYVIAADEAPYGYPDEIDFSDDGICVVDGEKGMYSFKQSRLLLSAMGQIYSYRYDKTGDYSMTLDDGSGAVQYVTHEFAFPSESALSSIDANEGAEAGPAYPAAPVSENAVADGAVAAEDDPFAPKLLDGVREFEGFYYVLYSDRTATVIGYSGEDDPDVPGWEITIPAKMDTYPVTAIRDFGSNYSGHAVTGIVLPDTVTTLYESAFRGCDRLEWIQLPDGLTTIGDYAFWGCKNLSELTIPAAVNEIGLHPFRFCDSLQLSISGDNPYLRLVDNVIFSKDMTRLLTYYGHMNSSYVIPDGVITIETMAFSDCDDLSAVVVPEGVVNIGEGAFSGCSNLSSISLPTTAVTIGDYDGCAFESFTLPDGITSVSASFLECESLSEFNIPSSVKELYVKFEDCTALTSFYVPEGVTTVHCQFEGCYDLYTIYLPDSATDIYRQINITSRETAATIVCHAGSCAESLAIETGMDYRLE